MKSPILTIYFDYGNVLTLPSDTCLSTFLQKTAKLHGLSYPRLREAYEKHRPLYDQDRLTTEQYWKAVFKDAGEELPLQELPRIIQQDDSCWSKINPDVLSWIENLKEEGYRVGLLTNMPSRFYRTVIEPAPWKNLFQYQVVSGLLGLVKPDPAIFNHAIQITGQPAETIIYMDDIQIHVDSAARLGIHAHLFEGLEVTAENICSLYNLPYPSISFKRTSL
jgi:putative hydrolase of the HAD superfamily